MLLGALQDVVHLVDVVGVEPDVAVEGQTLVGLVSTMVTVSEAEVDDAFRAGAPAEDDVYLIELRPPCANVFTGCRW